MDLVGEIRMDSNDPEHHETILRLLQEFMEEHQIDKIDIGWRRTRAEQ